MWSSSRSWSSAAPATSPDAPDADRPKRRGDVADIHHRFDPAASTIRATRNLAVLVDQAAGTGVTQTSAIDGS
ncbi:hypothetical protein GCM10027614_01670 [Micromonospora vulcania]